MIQLYHCSTITVLN